MASERGAPPACAAALALALALAPGVGLATEMDEAVSLCAEALAGGGAGAPRDLRLSRHDHVPYVYGTVDFDEVPDVRFRCKVYRDVVWSIEYRVRDQGAWTPWRGAPPAPRRAPEMPADPPPATPQPPSAGPHFSRPPEG